MSPRKLRAGCPRPYPEADGISLLFSRAFSLMELLVTVAIIAILAVLLGMGFGALKPKMEAAKCTSNLRQVGTALFAYTADSGNGNLPARYAPDDRSGIRSWPQRLLTLGYVGNPEIFYCPSYFPRNDAEARSIGRDASTQSSATYGMRDWTLPRVGSASNKSLDKRLHKPLAVIKNPADFFLVADSFWAASGWISQGYGISSDKSGTAQNRIHLRHQHKANTFFADGHVAPMPGEYFLALNDPNRMEGEPQYEYDQGPNYQFAVEEDPNPPRP